MDNIFSIIKTCLSERCLRPTKANTVTTHKEGKAYQINKPKTLDWKKVYKETGHQVKSNKTDTHQQHRAEGLGGLRHVDGATVAHHLCHVGQGAAVVQMEVADDDAVQEFCQWTVCDVGEVWEPSLIIEPAE